MEDYGNGEDSEDDGDDEEVDEEGDDDDKTNENGSDEELNEDGGDEGADDDMFYNSDYDDKLGDMLEEEHEDRTLDWEDTVATFYHKHQALLVSLFGLDLWIATVRLQKTGWGPVQPPWQTHQDRHTTVVYLTLPNGSARRNMWQIGAYEHNFRSDVEYGYGMSVQPEPVPTEKSLERFKRALSRLGLEVFVHPSQGGAGPSAPSNLYPQIASTAETQPAAPWPRLTVLVRSTTETEFN